MKRVTAWTRFIYCLAAFELGRNSWRFPTDNFFWRALEIALFLITAKWVVD